MTTGRRIDPVGDSGLGSAPVVSAHCADCRQDTLHVECERETDGA